MDYISRKEKKENRRCFIRPSVIFRDGKPKYPTSLYAYIFVLPLILAMKKICLNKIKTCMDQWSNTVSMGKKCQHSEAKSQNVNEIKGKWFIHGFVGVLSLITMQPES